jgi:hypothetical protein
MPTINLLPQSKPVPPVLAGNAMAQSQALQGSSQFVMMDTSARHLIDRTSQARTAMSVVAQSTPVVFAFDNWLDKYWYFTAPASLIIGGFILYLLGRISKKIWPLKDEGSILEGDELGENFIGPRYAPGIKRKDGANSPD